LGLASMAKIVILNRTVLLLKTKIHIYLRVTNQ
jgi:hypothetical protein